MVAEHGEDDLLQGRPGTTTGGMDIPVEAVLLPTPGEVPQAQLPVEPGETTAGPSGVSP